MTFKERLIEAARPDPPSSLCDEVQGILQTAREALEELIDNKAIKVLIHGGLVPVGHPPVLASEKRLVVLSALDKNQKETVVFKALCTTGGYPVYLDFPIFKPSANEDGYVVCPGQDCLQAEILGFFESQYPKEIVIHCRKLR